MIETYIIYRGDKEEYLFTISIPEEIFEKRKDSIFIIVQSYCWRLLTEKLKNDIKNKVLNLIKTDLRKYKLEQLLHE